MSVYMECGPGWKKHIDAILPEAKKQDIKIVQIKEKYGGIRIYTDKHTDIFDELVRQAEEKCSHTCELCGKENQHIRDIRGWLTTRCDDCEAKHVR